MTVCRVCHKTIDVDHDNWQWSWITGTNGVNFTCSDKCRATELTSLDIKITITDGNGNFIRNDHQAERK